MASENNDLQSGYTGSDYDSSLETPAVGPASGSAVAPEAEPRRHFFSLRHRRAIFVVNGLVLLLIIIIGAVSFFLATNSKQGGSPTTAKKATNYAVSSLPVGNVKSNVQLQVGEADHLTINGQVIVGNTLVLSPTATPASPVAGQIYYSQVTNQPYYYNGTRFVSFAQGDSSSSATLPSQLVNSIGGSSGAIGLGNGLQIAGGRLAVQLQAGNGIAVNGSTVSNNGVVSLAPGSSNISITQDGSGHYTISDSTIGLISGSGTTGYIPLFTPNGQTLGDSILNQSGTTVTVGGSLGVNGTILANVLQQTASGNDLSLAAGGNNLNVTAANSLFSGSLSVGGGNLTVDASGNLITNGTISADTLQSNGAGTDLNLSASRDINVTPARNLNVTVAGGLITFSQGSGLGAVSFTFPTTGGLNQVICTTRISCAAGGGQAVLLGYGTAQTDATAGSSVWINRTATNGNIIELQGGSTVSPNNPNGGVDEFVVAYNGNTTIGGTLNVASSAFTVDGSGNVAQSGNLTVQGTSGVTIGTGSAAGNLNLYSGANSKLGTLKIASLGQAATYTLPDPGQTTDTICLVHLANCAGTGGGVTTSGGTNNYIAKFTGNQTIGNASIFDNGTGVSIGSAAPVGLFSVGSTNQFQVSNLGAVTAVGLNSGTGQIQGSGGLAVSGNSTITGTLGSLTGLTSSGSITFSSLGTGVLQATSGVLGTGAVALGTQTTGGYVANLGILTGLTTTGNTGAGSTPTLSVTYGSTPNTAAQGNTQLTCPSGTGNLSGGGDLITIGTGGTCSNLSITNSPTFSGSLAVQGASGITVGSTTNTGILNFLDGTNDSFSASLGLSGTLGASQAFLLPTTGGTLCTTTTCAAGSGSGYVQLQGSSPGTTQTGDININGTIIFGALGTGVIHASSLGQLSSSLVANSDLVNSSITISNGTNITGGGTVSLGGTLTVGTVTNPSFSGLITGSSGTTGLALTGTPVAGTGATSLLQLGGAISGGNSTTNGGTYIGINEPSTGNGSAADFLNFQHNNVSELKVDNAGNASLAGALNFNLGKSTSVKVTASQPTTSSGNTVATVNIPSLNITSNTNFTFCIVEITNCQQIVNDTTLQTAANFNIQSVATTSPTIRIQQLSGQTADLVDAYDSTGTTPLFTVGSTGNVYAAGTITAANSLNVGTASSLNGTISFANQSGGNTVSLQASSTNPTSSLTLVLPTSAPVNSCLKVGSVVGSVATLSFATCTSSSGGGGGGSSSILNFQTSGTLQSGATFDIQNTDYTAGNVIVEGPSPGSGSAADLLQFQNNSGGAGGFGTVTSAFSPTGAYLRLDGASSTYSSALSIGTSAAQTAQDGINLGSDLQLYRSNNGLTSLLNLQNSANVQGQSATQSVTLQAGNLSSLTNSVSGTTLNIAAGGGVGGGASGQGGNLVLQVYAPITISPNSSFVNASSTTANGLAVDSNYIWYQCPTSNICRASLSNGVIQATKELGAGWKPSGSISQVNFIADCNGYLYVATSGRQYIGQFKINGDGSLANMGGVNQYITSVGDATGVSGMSCVANSNGSSDVYWSDASDGYIGYAAISSSGTLGTQYNTFYQTGTSTSLTAVMTDPGGNYVYYAAQGTFKYIKRASISCVFSSGCSTTTVDSTYQATLSATINSLTVNGSNIFWSITSSNSLCYASLSGTSNSCNAVTPALPASFGPRELASSTTLLYFGGNGNTIGRYPIGGTIPNVTQNVMTLSGLNGSANFQNAVDSATGFQINESGQFNTGSGVTLFNANTLSSVISTLGQLSIQGGLSTSSLANITGTTPTVTKACSTTCSFNYSYEITALNGKGGETLPSAAGSVSSANISTGVNTIAWNPVSGAASYNVYRTVASDGSGTGLLANVTAQDLSIGGTYTFSDTGVTATAQTPPTVDNSGELVAGGTALFQDATNATTAFQIQNAAGTTLFDADTTNLAVGIGGASTTAGYTLNVTGTINASSAISVNGVAVCTVNTCAAGSSTSSFINNSTTLQTNANLAIQSASASSVVALIQGAASQTADLLDVKNALGAAMVLSISSTGSLRVAPSSNSSTAFQVVGTSGITPLDADTANGRVGINTTIPNQSLTINGGNQNFRLGTPGSPSATPSASGGSMATGTYYYKVTALDGAGNETAIGSSTEVSAAVTGPTGSVTVAWNAVTAALGGYRVYRGTTAGNETLYFPVALGTNSLVDTGTAGTSCGGSCGATTSNASSVFINGSQATGGVSYFDEGNVGIGTATPTTLLDVAGNALFQNASNSTTAFEIQNQAGTSNLFIGDTTNGKIGIGGAPTSTGATLQVTGGVSATLNFGIATSSSSSGSYNKATVAGTGGVSANDVVVLNSSSQAVDSTTVRDPRVYGVATGAAAASAVTNVALAGDATVNAEATSTPISVGDQLVISAYTDGVHPTGGYVKSDNTATTGIVGTALSSLASGTGTVSVAVNVVHGQTNPTFRGSGDSSTVAGSGILFQNASDSTNAFEIQNAAGTSNLFVVDTTDGKIGIGGAPSSGSQTLQVTGGVAASTSFGLSSASASSGSIYKIVTAGTGGVSVNDVVVINSSNQVVDTTTARDTRVYGVAGGNATSGNGTSVYLFGNTTVNATGPISIGDQLVTSTTSGRVVADNSATSGILGTALSALASGNGTVSVAIRPVGGQSTPIFSPQTDSTTAFQIQNAARSTTVLGIDTTNSKVGIGGAPSSGGSTLQVTGTASVSSTLTVNGGIQSTSGNSFQITNTSTSNAYISKLATAGTGGVSVNDVVIMNTADQVVDTTTARDSRVYGIANNTAGSGVSVGVAISGNYTVNATAVSTPINVGDQLVTSTTSGAVKSDNTATTGIVGTALSSLASGTGTVSVAVNVVHGQTNPTFRGSGDSSTVAGSGILFQNASDSTNAFEIQNAAGTSNLFIADTTNGKIGIGGAPTSSGSILQVTGSITSSGGITEGGNIIINTAASGNGSISKPIIAGTGGVSTGDVAILNSSDQLVDTTTARDPRVYGVVFTGAIATGTAYVVLSGDATVNATGPINVGDQLVTSTTSGRVVADNNATTGIVGVALTALASGNGTVSVAVNAVHGQYTPNFRPGSDSGSTFNIQNAAGTAFFTADSSDLRITVTNLVVTATLTVDGHVITGNSSGSTTPAAQTALGSAGACSLTPASFAAGNDTSGTLTITPGGTGIANGIQCVVNFSSAYGSYPHVVLTPADAASQALGVYGGATSASTFNVGVATAGLSGVTYTYNYFIAQ